MGETSTLNLQKWIDDHRNILKPPVGNKMIWPDREFIVMAIGGPNQRDDYHVNEGEEFFYQLEGKMTLKIIEDGEFKDIALSAGEVYLLPPRIPHSPQREKNSVGMVIERKRRPHEQDGLLWFCRECHNKLYEEFFHLTNIETQFPPVFDRFYENHTLCTKCGHDNQKKQIS